MRQHTSPVPPKDHYKRRNHHDGNCRSCGAVEVSLSLENRKEIVVGRLYDDYQYGEIAHSIQPTTGRLTLCTIAINDSIDRGIGNLYGEAIVTFLSGREELTFRQA